MHENYDISRYNIKCKWKKYRNIARRWLTCMSRNTYWYLALKKVDDPYQALRYHSNWHQTKESYKKNYLFQSEVLVHIPEELTMLSAAPSPDMTHNFAPFPSHVCNQFPAVPCSLQYELCFLYEHRHDATERAGEYFTTTPRVMPSLDVHSRTHNNLEVLWWETGSIVGASLIHQRRYLFCLPFSYTRM
jgi:hypothetical protein